MTIDRSYPFSFVFSTLNVIAALSTSVLISFRAREPDAIAGHAPVVFAIGFGQVFPVFDTNDIDLRSRFCLHAGRSVIPIFISVLCLPS